LSLMRTPRSGWLRLVRAGSPARLRVSQLPATGLAARGLTQRLRRSGQPPRRQVQNQGAFGAVANGQGLELKTRAPSAQWPTAKASSSKPGRLRRSGQPPRRRVQNPGAFGAVANRQGLEFKTRAPSAQWPTAKASSSKPGACGAVLNHQDVKFKPGRLRRSAQLPSVRFKPRAKCSTTAPALNHQASSSTPGPARIWLCTISLGRLGAGGALALNCRSWPLLLGAGGAPGFELTALAVDNWAPKAPRALNCRSWPLITGRRRRRGL
jgi:hypothetical protein